MAECNYSIVLDESKGRVLVAKNDIPQGDLILQEAPLGEFFPDAIIVPCRQVEMTNSFRNAQNQIAQSI